MKLADFDPDDLIKYKNETLYYYDVNSLYPYIMATQPMPVGKPIYFEGNIRS